MERDQDKAKAFCDEFADATYEKGETQAFYNEFFQVFGIKRRQVARYEEHIKKLNEKSGFIDLFWPKVLLVEQKSAGRSLDKAGVSGWSICSCCMKKSGPGGDCRQGEKTAKTQEKSARSEELTFAAWPSLPDLIE